MLSLSAQAHRQTKRHSYCETLWGLQALYGVFWGF